MWRIKYKTAKRNPRKNRLFDFIQYSIIIGNSDLNYHKILNTNKQFDGQEYKVDYGLFIVGYDTE